MEETNRPRYAFKIGQQVYRHTGAPSRGTQRTGPYMIVGLVQQDSAFFYRLSGPRGEHLAPESELKLALQPRDRVDLPRFRGEVRAWDQSI
jgi:hypothetical protein